MRQSENSPVNRKIIVVPSRIVGYRVQKVFEQNGNQWETIQGIAESANLPYDLVERHITRHPTLYKKSPITIGGIPIFALQKSADIKTGNSVITRRIAT